MEAVGAGPPGRLFETELSLDQMLEPEWHAEHAWQYVADVELVSLADYPARAADNVGARGIYTVRYADGLTMRQATVHAADSLAFESDDFAFRIGRAAAVVGGALASPVDREAGGAVGSCAGRLGAACCARLCGSTTPRCARPRHNSSSGWAHVRTLRCASSVSSRRGVTTRRMRCGPPWGPPARRGPRVHWRSHWGVRTPTMWRSLRWRSACSAHRPRGLPTCCVGARRTPAWTCARRPGGHYGAVQGTPSAGSAAEPSCAQPRSLATATPRRCWLSSRPTSCRRRSATRWRAVPRIRSRRCSCSPGTPRWSLSREQLREHLAAVEPGTELHFRLGEFAATG